MTAQNNLDQILAGWLAEEAAAPPSEDALGRIIDGTRQRRPRPAFAAVFGSHWVGTGATRWAGGIGLRPALVWALLVLALLIALIGVLVLGAGRQPSRPAVVRPPATASPSRTVAPTPFPTVASTLGPVAAQSFGESPTPAVFPSFSAAPAGQPSETKVADMHVGRFEPVVVTLADGRVLVVGGLSEAPGEIVDATKRRSTVTDPGAVTGNGSGVLLKDGRVLLALADGNDLLASVFMFDPADTSWTKLDAPDYQGDWNHEPSSIHIFPTLTLLDDGGVLLSGGRTADPEQTRTAVNWASVFDPVTETFSRTGSMTHARFGHSATLMSDGRVLIAGGWGSCTEPSAVLHPCSFPDLSDAEIYDPATGLFTETDSMVSSHGTTDAMLHQDGRVLVIATDSEERDGGDGNEGPGIVETYDPALGTFDVAGTTPHLARTTALLPDGRVFLTGQWNGLAIGDEPIPLVTWAGIFDPATGLTTDALPPAAEFQEPAVLPDGRVVLVGGPWAEVYTWR